MKLLLLSVEVLLILKITNVKSQFMPPQMGGMQFPQMPQMSMGAPMQMPPGMPMPGMPMPGMPMPGMPMPGMPMPMPMSFMGQPKLPMVVMPYHTKKQDKLHGKKSRKGRKDKRKKRKKKKYIPISSSSDSSSSSSESSDVSDVGFRSMKKNLKRNLRARKHKKRSQVLTPVISYVTKDGYVVYQKKIKKDKAKDWLEMGNRSPIRQGESAEKQTSSEEMLRKVLRRRMDKVRS